MRELAEFEAIGELSLSGSPVNPTVGLGGTDRSYSKKYNFYSISHSADYLVWARSDWAERVDEFARALTITVQRVAKSRLTSAQREHKRPT